MSDILRKILVVDDEAGLRDIVVTVLKKEHRHIDEAEDGDQALQRLMTEQYVLVISDINMPNKDGLDLLAAAREKGITTPFVFITASEDRETLVKALRLGAFDFLQKPFDHNEVKAIVNRAVEVGVRRLSIAAGLTDRSVYAAERIARDEKMIRLLELKNYKKNVS